MRVNRGREREDILKLCILNDKRNALVDYSGLDWEDLIYFIVKFHLFLWTVMLMYCVISQK